MRMPERVLLEEYAKTIGTALDPATLSAYQDVTLRRWIVIFCGVWILLTWLSAFVLFYQAGRGVLQLPGLALTAYVTGATVQSCVIVARVIISDVFPRGRSGIFRWPRGDSAQHQG